MDFKKREYIYIALLAIFCPIALLAFIYSVANIDIKSLVLSEAHILTIVGIIVSTVGLIFTVYFVVLSVSARKMQLDIENAFFNYKELSKQKEDIKNEMDFLNKSKDKIKNDIEQLSEMRESIRIDLNNLKFPINSYLNDLSNKKKQLNYLLSDYAESLYENFEVQIGLASSSASNSSLKKELILKRARLSYKYPMLKSSERERLLTELGNIGEIIDIVPVQKIIDDENESELIKVISIEVLKSLKQKWNVV